MRFIHPCCRFVELWSSKLSVAADSVGGAGDLCPASLMGAAASNGPAALAACQQQFMQELFADTLRFAGELGVPDFVSVSTVLQYWCVVPWLPPTWKAQQLLHCLLLWMDQHHEIYFHVQLCELMNCH